MVIHLQEIFLLFLVAAVQLRHNICLAVFLWEIANIRTIKKMF